MQKIFFSNTSQKKKKKEKCKNIHYKITDFISL